MKFKKILCAALIGLLCFLNFNSGGVNALFGNTHFNLGKMIIEKSKINLSKSEKEAFLAGIVYADIGRFEFDKKTGIDSDSDEFARKMEQLTVTSEEKWFVNGFKIHIFQDKETLRFLKGIFSDHKYSSYMQYMADCGTLDSYFLKKSGMIHNEFLSSFDFEKVISVLNINDISKICGTSDKESIKNLVMSTLKKYSDFPKESLIIYDSLIQKAYRSFNFEISLDQIHEQAGNLFGAFTVAADIISEKVIIPEKLSFEIGEKCEELVDLCISEFDFMRK